MDDERKKHTLNALVEGRDIVHCKAEAREFLNALLEISTPDVLLLALPVARQLMAYKGWQERLNIFELRDYCIVRLNIVVYLNGLDTCGTNDPAVDYMVGLVANIVERLGLILPRRETLM
jgi:hypothetical protein